MSDKTDELDWAATATEEEILEYIEQWKTANDRQLEEYLCQVPEARARFIKREDKDVGKI